MEVIIQKDAQAAASLTARIIAKALRAKPSMVLGLATGSTMESVYGFLVEAHEKEGLDFSSCMTFNLDEYIGLPPENEHSYRAYMNTHLFNKINIDLHNTHIPDGTAEVLDLECRRYEDAITDCGGIDLQLLGIGRSGHIGFNEPLSAFHSRTRVTPLTPETIAQNSPLFGDPKLMPRRAITMGVGTIMESKRCIMLATGSEKAKVVAKAVEGPLTSMVSASALQFHPQCTVIVDEVAAVNLQGKDYYREMFENEPRWEEFR